MAFELPPLPYKYDALEPYIDEETMHLHHDKHHAAYVENLNKALVEHPKLQAKKVEELLTGEVPAGIQQAVINHGGGHYNHSLFWEMMSPFAKKAPEGKLAEAINSTFGDLTTFKEKFTEKAMGVFGSGWAWLILTPEKKLTLKRHSFQNPPLAKGNQPVLGIDVWEHAYYLKYQNRKADYIKAWWNVVNWQKAGELFGKAS
jgi:Fe-Mn family superoxide dismutase